MASLDDYTRQLLARQDLDDAQILVAAQALASAEVPDQEKAAFLTALSDKGEKPAEVAAFARAFLGMAVNPGVEAWAPKALDIVGTGGDHAGGFNISSLVVLVLACAGVPVMKHGNRGVTSKCGSADLLSALGTDISAPLERQREALASLGYVFFFAPNHHPAFRHVAPVRKLLAGQGRRTVFNILGPLINPGRPAYAMIGVFSPAWVPVMAQALGRLHTRSGIAVHGVIGEGKGIDELTSATVNQVHGIGALSTLSATWVAEDFGMKRSDFSDLLGGTVATNVAITESLLEGRGPSGLEDTITLNAATGLWITGKVPSVQDGIGQARELLLGGAVRTKIADTRDFFSSK
jgi:anthranilate phosphoribosyltransferase